MQPPIRLVTLGTLRLDGSGWRPAKALALLTYLSLQGPTPRRRLRELFWPQAQDAGASLRVVLGQFRRHLPGVLRGEETLETEIESDAAHLLGLGERRGDAADAETYAGPFLAGVELNEVSAELEEWVLDTRERLAGAARLAMVRAAELAGSPAEAAGWIERAAATAEAQPPETDLLERMLRLTLPGSLLEAELRTELAGLSVSASQISLPVPEQELLGRERELSELLLALSDPAVRLLEITGAGGIGKSTLATALLREQADLSGVQVLSVALESALASSEAAARMVVALNLQVTDRGDGWLALAHAWGERPLLALLDGVEGLPDLGRGVSTLLAHCPGVRLVITSRVQRLTGGVSVADLGIAGLSNLGLSNLELSNLGLSNTGGAGRLEGSVHLALDGLSVPAPGESPARMARCAAVQLFVRGARRYLPRFAADEQNAPLVSAIVRRLDGHPLATVLSATWMRVYPPAQIHTLILQDLAALRAEDSWRERHQLSAVFERSWQLLTPEEAQAVSALAVFQGFTPDAALSVAGVTPALLSSLMAHSLLRALPQGRLEVPPVLAAQAQAHLPDAAAVQDAHAGYYLEHLMGHAPESDEVDTERANIVAAVAYSLSRGRDVPGQIDTLLASYDRRGLLDSGTDAFHMFKETLTTQESASAESVLVGLAWLAWLASRYSDAENICKAIIGQEIHVNKLSRMKAMNILAISLRRRGLIEKSLEYSLEALKIATEYSDEDRKAMYALNVSETYLELGQPDKAYDLVDVYATCYPDGISEIVKMYIESQRIGLNYYFEREDAVDLKKTIENFLHTYYKYCATSSYLIAKLTQARLAFADKKILEAAKILKELSNDLDNTTFYEVKIGMKCLSAEIEYLDGRSDRSIDYMTEILNLCEQTDSEQACYEVFTSLYHVILLIDQSLAPQAINFAAKGLHRTYAQNKKTSDKMKELGVKEKHCDLSLNEIKERLRLRISDIAETGKF